MKKRLVIARVYPSGTYDRSSAYSVSESEAEKISSLLNQKKYMIEDGEKWEPILLTFPQYENSMAKWQGITIRNGSVYEYAKRQ